MRDYNIHDFRDLEDFFKGKPEVALTLFLHFVNELQKVGPVTLHPAKTMIGVANANKRIVYITQPGKNFIHVVFPFKQPYPDNLCFQKIAQVPGDMQFNHHFRMLSKEDVNDEVIEFMRLAYNGE
ncbi:DUF5655 domain-containing protein [Mucilaginibacter sp. McL0603]|uniref:DUF5655 domain-containing protein n=1 Tax=Mucilaginibacter sp. McL0603 TaxID=3415670 RepID=UPI003CF3B22D